MRNIVSGRNINNVRDALREEGENVAVLESMQSGVHIVEHAEWSMQSGVHTTNAQKYDVMVSNSKKGVMVASKLEI